MSVWLMLFIILAIAMLVGPIMIMQPSARDQRLAKCRQRAAALGLQVKAIKVGEQYLMSYRLPVPVVLGEEVAAMDAKDLPCWQLMKQPYAHELHFYGKWQLQSKASAIPQHYQDQLRVFIDTLPEDVVGLEVNPDAIGLVWLESPGSITVEQIRDHLKELHRLISG